jgi:transposase
MNGGNISKASEFTWHDRRRLAAALTQARDARVCRRLEALLLLAEGQSVSETARRVRVDRATVQRWIEWYLRRRATGDLVDYPRSGRPRVADELTDEMMAAVLACDPREKGFATTTWTVPLLTTYLNETYKIEVTQRTLRRRLHEFGYRWKRPRYVYTGREPNLAQKKGLILAD